MGCASHARASAIVRLPGVQQLAQQRRAYDSQPVRNIFARGRQQIMREAALIDRRSGAAMRARTLAIARPSTATIERPRAPSRAHVCAAAFRKLLIRFQN
ncbi:hypothetical protein F511_10501 [Dorcoceras hygrometricum]|uniref:Uncharacterized protein n=1 Tax=Dorcoceras hygrometricum TaxID=472368 RepID=A0A2Z7A2G0_9LAMI|nr:hypothetical protein F511_10501 [Dorcoceras hygrometricum]